MLKSYNNRNLILYKAKPSIVFIHLRQQQSSKWARTNKDGGWD